MIISGQRSISNSEMQSRTARATTGLRSIGVGDQSPVALMLRNDFLFFEVSSAASSLGSPVVPINWHLKAEEVAYILADSGADVLVCHADLLPQIVDGLPRHINLFTATTPPEVVSAFGIDASRAVVPDHSVEWSSWRDTHRPSPPSSLRAAPMYYTSGTTGAPKGVRRRSLNSQQMLGSERVGAIAYGIKPHEGQVVLINGPMYHSAPNSYGMLAFRQGCKIVLQTRFDPEELLALIQEHRVTHMHMVPTMFVRLLKLTDAIKGRYDLSSLRFVVHGAAPCPPHVKRAMIEWWGPVIHEYFGATETGVPVWHSAEEALRKPGTVGRSIEGGIVRIYRPDGSLCGANEPGEIFMRQTNMPDFDYHGDAQARAEVGRDGLISVGDVGYLDEDGYLFLCDRKRDMVISGGVNIYPAEIESALITMPGIHDCAVFGIPDEEFGERLCAYVQPEGGAALTADHVRQYLRQRLANFKVPQVVEFASDLPREATGKIFKRKLRDPYWTEQAQQR